MSIKGSQRIRHPPARLERTPQDSGSGHTQGCATALYNQTCTSTCTDSSARLPAEVAAHYCSTRGTLATEVSAAPAQPVPGSSHVVRQTKGGGK